MIPPRRHRRNQLEVATLALILALLTVPGLATGSVLLSTGDEDLLVLSIVIDQYTASEAMIGYKHDEKVLVPVGELAAALEYSIVSIPERYLAEGWLTDEDQAFRIDLRAGTVEVAGETHALDGECAFVNEYDIYVTTDVLAQWWPMTFEFDPRQLKIDIVPQGPIPLLKRLERQHQWSRFSRSQGWQEESYPQTRAPYRMVSWPFLDAQLTLQASEEGREGSGSLLGRGDLARLSTTGFLGWSSQRQDSWQTWLRAGRTDRGAQLLGPLHATSFQVGDVASVALPLTGGTVRGRGLTVSNRYLGSTSQFDAVDVIGDASPGWEVELYLDGSLRDIQVASEDGQYRFEQVPLHVGVNTVRVVLYGPSGQTREDVRTYNIRSGMRRTGTLQYDYSSVQASTGLLGGATSENGPVDSGNWQHQFALRYGVAPTTTVGAALTYAERDSVRRRVAVGELFQSLGPALIQAAAAKDFHAGAAGRLALQSLIGQRSLSLAYERYDDFPSQSSSALEALDSRLLAQTAGKIGGDRRSAWNYRFEWERNSPAREDIDHVSKYGFYLGGAVKRLNFGNGVQHRRAVGGVTAGSTLGQFYMTSHSRGTRVSGSLNYRLDGGDFLQSVGATLSRGFSPRLHGNLNSRYQFVAGGRFGINGRLDWDLDPVRIGFQGSIQDDHWSVGLSASTSLSRSPDGKTWVFSRRPLSNFGAALAQVFIDRNGDGVYGGGDDPLPGVEFGGNRLWDQVRTAEDGQAFLPGIPADQFTNVDLVLQSVADPYLVPVYPSMTTLVHAGGISDLQFPWRYVGEIEGFVARDEGHSRPLRNVGLELVGQDGEQTATAVSEFDGYYFFHEIPPGDYQMKVVERTLRGKDLLVPESVPVTIPEEGGFVTGPTIVLLSDKDLPDEVVPDEVVPDEAIVAQAGEDPSAADTPAGGSSGTVSEQAVEPSPRSSDAARTAGSVAVASVAPDARPYDEVRNRRTLHLVHEMLFRSQLFARR